MNRKYGNSFIHGPEKDYVNRVDEPKPRYPRLSVLAYILTIPLCTAVIAMLSEDLGNFTIKFVIGFCLGFILQAVVLHVVDCVNSVIKGANRVFRD